MAGSEGWKMGKEQENLHHEAGDKLRGTLWTLLMILIFDLTVLECHQRVLNSGMMGSELRFEKFILLLLSEED